MFLAKHLVRTSSWIGGPNWIRAVRSGRSSKSNLILQAFSLVKMPRFDFTSKLFSMWTVSVVDELYAWFFFDATKNPIPSQSVYSRQLSNKHTAFKKGFTVKLDSRRETRAITWCCWCCNLTVYYIREYNTWLFPVFHDTLFSTLRLCLIYRNSMKWVTTMFGCPTIIPLCALSPPSISWHPLVHGPS